MKRRVYVIEPEAAKTYRKTLLALRKRMVATASRTSDGSFKQWNDRHIVVVDDLLKELGGRTRDDSPAS